MVADVVSVANISKVYSVGPPPQHCATHFFGKLWCVVCANKSVSMEMRSVHTWERIYCTRGNLKIVKKIAKLTSTENVLYASKQIMD